MTIKMAAPIATIVRSIFILILFTNVCLAKPPNIVFVLTDDQDVVLGGQVLLDLDELLSVKYMKTMEKQFYICERSRLKSNRVPSIFDCNTKQTVVAPRPKRQHQLRELESSEAINDVQNEVTVQASNVDDDSTPITEDPKSVSYVDETEQCDIVGRYSIDKYINNPKAMSYYTGFQDYEHFMYFFHVLGPAAYELKYQCILLSAHDQLFMTLMKLRQAKDDIELSLFFDVSESTVSHVIITWINFMYFQLKEINIWPSREVVDEHMPHDFVKKFSTTRVILDATENPIVKPSNVNAQSATWSGYKHRNTLKTMIGCTPRGAVSFISDSYGGSASDRQIIEKSSLLDTSKNLFEKGDSIMADRGIMVQDLFAFQNVRVNTPTMLKGKSQLEPQEIVKDRRIASKRIHIERIIGLSKTFKILKTDLPSSKLQLGSRIVFICFAISNFRSSIVSKYA